MMQNFGLEDLSHVQSPRNLLKYLVRLIGLRGAIDRFWQNKFPPKSRHGVQTRLRALLEPAINKKRESNKSESSRIFYAKSAVRKPRPQN